MTSRRIDFSDVHLYAVTPDVKDEARTLATVEKLLAGGVDAVQLRSRTLTDRGMVELGLKIKAACEKHQALFLVDNRADLAAVLKADGLHLGRTDLPLAMAREIVGHRCLIGASAHALPQALEAQRSGADYVSCGPLWATPTKPDYKPVGLGLIGLYRAALRIPFVVIGGVDRGNVDQVIQSGARCVAVVRDLFDASDPEAAAREFKRKLSSQKVEVSS